MMQSPAFLREFVPPSQVVEGVSPLLTRPGETPDMDGYAKGLEDGRAQARAEIAAETLDAVKTLIDRLGDMTDLQSRMAAETNVEAGKVLTTVIRKLSPGLAAVSIADRARRLLENELSAAPRPLIVRVAPEIAEQLEQMIVTMPDTDFSVEAVETMAKTLIDVSWPQGGATVDAQALAERITGLTAELDPNSEPMEENPHDR